MISCYSKGGSVSGTKVTQSCWMVHQIFFETARHIYASLLRYVYLSNPSIS